MPETTEETRTHKRVIDRQELVDITIRAEEPEDPEADYVTRFDPERRCMFHTEPGFHNGEEVRVRVDHGVPEGREFDATGRLVVKKGWHLNEITGEPEKDKPPAAEVKAAAAKPKDAGKK